MEDGDGGAEGADRGEEGRGGGERVEGGVASASGKKESERKATNLTVVLERAAAKQQEVHAARRKAEQVCLRPRILLHLSRSLSLSLSLSLCPPLADCLATFVMGLRCVCSRVSAGGKSAA